MSTSGATSTIDLYPTFSPFKVIANASDNATPFYAWDGKKEDIAPGAGAYFSWYENKENIAPGFQIVPSIKKSEVTNASGGGNYLNEVIAYEDASGPSFAVNKNVGDASIKASTTGSPFTDITDAWVVSDEAIAAALDRKAEAISFRNAFADITDVWVVSGPAIRATFARRTSQL